MLIVLALLALVALVPSYLYLVHNRPILDPAAKASADVRAAERTEAFKIQAQIGVLQSMAASTSVMDIVLQAIDGKPTGIVIDHISFKSDAGQNTIVLAGSGLSRENINAFRKELEGKGIYRSVSVPVGDLIGSSGNQFTVTLLTKPQ